MALAAFQTSTFFRDDIQIESHSGEDSIAFWNSMEETLDILNSAKVGNLPLKEFEFFIHTQGLKAELVRQQAQSWIASQPQSGLPFYFLAHTEAATGHFSTAKEMIQEARQREPGNVAYSSAEERIEYQIQNGNSGDPFYLIDMAALTPVDMTQFP